MSWSPPDQEVGGGQWSGWGPIRAAESWPLPYDGVAPLERAGVPEMEGREDLQFGAPPRQGSAEAAGEREADWEDAGD